MSIKNRQLLNSRLDRILPKLGRTAKHQAWAAYGDLEPEDVLQNMALAILEFGEHKHLGDGYYINRARWSARDHARHARIYRRYCTHMPLAIEDDGEAVDYAEFLPDPDTDADPEARLLAAERLAAMRARLTPPQRRILDRLLAGYRKSEIAAELGVSRTRISNLLTEMRVALAGFAPE